MGSYSVRRARLSSLINIPVPVFVVVSIFARNARTQIKRLAEAVFSRVV